MKYYFANQISKDLKLFCYDKEWGFPCTTGVNKTCKSKPVICYLLIYQDIFKILIKTRKSNVLFLLKAGDGYMHIHYIWKYPPN